MEVTIIIIAKNESGMIGDCLKSLENFKDILVIDTGSIDKTVEIAKKYKARVVSFTSGKNFSDWRNKGLSESKTKWILYIDADERMTPKLESEIKEITNKENPLHSVYAIPRRNIILGKELKYGGWYPDYQKRLFFKSSLQKWEGYLHEEPIFSGSLGHIKNPMIHQKHETFSEMVEKTNTWSEVEAKLMFDAHHPKMNIIRFLTAMWREFWKRMIVKAAFLDGKTGIMFAIYQVFSKFISYAKLWEMQIK